MSNVTNVTNITKNSYQNIKRNNQISSSPLIHKVMILEYAKMNAYLLKLPTAYTQRFLTAHYLKPPCITNDQSTCFLDTSIAFHLFMSLVN